MSSIGVITTVCVLLGGLIMGLRARRQLKGLRKGDLVKTEVPRVVNGPLAMGTRLDAASALKKAGVPRDEIDRLMDGDHDQELCDRYWALRA